MSSFRLSQEARGYFRQINERSTTGTFDTLWDQYYLSAMAGIKNRTRVPEDEEPPNDREFHDEVIQDYSNQRYEIYSALIVAEIERESISWDEKSDVQGLMLDILDSESHTGLSEEGRRVLNCYAENGFRLIRTEIPSPPELDEFLEEYHAFLNELPE